MKKSIVIAGLLAAASALELTACTTVNREQAALLAKAKVDRQQAALAALAHAPGGRIKNCELDGEGGKLTWWFDIAVPGSETFTEVSVDAMTGGVISVATEIPEDQ